MRDVLIVTDYLLAGGVERQTTELALRLDRTQFRVRVVCLYGARARLSLHFMPRLTEAGIPVTVLDLPLSPAGKLAGWQALIRLVRQQRPHIIHALNYHSNLLTRLTRPFMPPRTMLIGSVRTAYTAKQLLYERLSWRLCAVVTCNSPHLAAQLTQQAHVPAAHVEIIPNGVDTQRFDRPPDEQTVHRLRQGASRVLLMVGRITQQKSPHLLAQALGRLKRAGSLPDGVRVWIVGAVEEADVQSALEQAIAADGLETIVTQHPATDQPEQFYHAADVVILATLWEGLPNVAIEALACGRPVLISQAANEAGVIEEGVTGWIARTGDVDDLARRLSDVLTADIDPMRPACRARAQHYAMPHMVARYEALYDRLSATPSP